MNKKLDIIFKDLTFGSLVSILCASGVMLIVSILIPLLVKEEIANFIPILTMLPSVCVGVIAIYYLVCGCLSLQYMRLFMSFGSNRRNASLRYLIRVVLAIIVSTICIILLNFICSFTGSSIVTNIDLIVMAITTSLFCFAAGCLFSSITTLFKPFISFIVIGTICLLYFTVFSNIEEIITVSISNKTVNFAEPISGVILAVIFYIGSLIIHNLRLSDMKTTSIS